MKKFVLKVVSMALAIISLFAVLFTFTGCGPNKKVYSLSNVVDGETFEIEIEGDRGDYFWKYVEDNDGVKYLSTTFPDDPNKVDGTGVRVYTFKAIKPGKHKIKFELTHIEDDSDVIEINIYEIKINPVELQENKIFTLSSVYNAKGITNNDLINIAYYSNKTTYNFKGFNPTPKGELANDVELGIKNLLAIEHNKTVVDEEHLVAADDFEITAYYGKYNGFYAFWYKQTNVDYPAVIVEEYETVGGIKFKYTTYNQRISLVKYVEE